MPITQNRLRALVTAARAHESAYATLRERVLNFAQTPQGPKDLEALIDSVFFYAPDPAHGQLIAKEEEHYKHTAGRNVLAAKYARERRANNGKRITPYAATRAQAIAHVRRQAEERSVEGPKTLAPEDIGDLGSLFPINTATSPAAAPHDPLDDPNSPEFKRAAEAFASGDKRFEKLSFEK